MILMFVYYINFGKIFQVNGIPIRKFREIFLPHAKRIDFLDGMFYTVVMEQSKRPEQTNEPVKRYPFKFSAVMITLFIAALALCVAGFALTTWRLIAFLGEGGDSIYSWIQFIILYFVSVFLAALIIAMLIRSQYVITEKQLILQFGFIKTKYEIKNIYSVHLFQGANKLAVYFDDFQTKYAVIVVKPMWYDDFIQALTARKPGIGFSFSTAEEEEEIKKNK